MDTLIGILAAVLLGTTAGLAAGPILRRLPEPAPCDLAGGEPKTPYADLADRRFAAGTGLIAFALSLISWSLLAPSQQAPWMVLATVGVLLALVDLRTTWLPLSLTRIGWLLMTLATGLTAALTGDGWLLLHAGLGALLAGGFFWIVWAVSRGRFGYGDVRYAPLVGAAAGSISVSTAMWALLCGTVVGGLVGVARLVRFRRGAFPYAPSILLGGYVALAGLALG